MNISNYSKRYATSWIKNKYFNTFSNLKKEIQDQSIQRHAMGIPTLPLNIEQVNTLCHIIEHHEYELNDIDFLLNKLKYRIIPGVDETSYVKANL